MTSPEKGQSFSLAWTIDREAGMIAVHVTGELDLASADELSEMLAHLLSQTDVLVLDLGKLDFMDSTGIRVLGRVHKNAESAGRRFLLGRPSAAVRRVLNVAGLVDMFDYVEGGPPKDRLCSMCHEYVDTDATLCPLCGGPLE